MTTPITAEDFELQRKRAVERDFWQRAFLALMQGEIAGLHDRRSNDEDIHHCAVKATVALTVAKERKQLYD